MKKLASALFMAAAAIFGANGQSYQQDKVNSEMMSFPIVDTRTEIYVPQINDYNVIKADLHVHTIYSDGSMTPKYRVMEAWRDGMDVIAITDHIEYRPNEKYMARYIYANEEVVVGDKNNIKCDLNLSASRAVSTAKYYDITVIPGIEITRKPNAIGHFNALFTRDNNAIPNPDPLQAIRNAKAQGALVQCNHPGWKNTSNEFTSVAKAALAEGLIDGVEVFNIGEFYPNVITKAKELGLYICGCTDSHYSTYDRHLKYDAYRNMTLILAKDNSLESVREALENKRTIAYGFGHLAGSEQLLKDMFTACVSYEHFYTYKNGYRYVRITNKSSFPFTLSFPDKSYEVTIPKMSSIIYITGEPSLKMEVTNMWCSEDEHPKFDFEF